MPQHERAVRCAGHHAGRRIAGGRHPFALPGAEAQYAPDLPGELLHIRLELTLDLEAKHLAGVAANTFRVLRTGLKRVHLDLVGLEVEWVRDAVGTDLTWHHEGGRLQVELAQAPTVGTEITLLVRYAGSPQAGMNFIVPDDEYPDRPLQAWSQGQDEYARFWFPCHDFPNARCTTEVLATVAGRFTTVSNGRLLEVTDNPDGTRTWHWREDVPHVAYLVSLVVGDFEHWSEDLDGVPLDYYVPPGRRADGERGFAGTADMVRLLSDFAGQPFPFEKYAQVVIRDFTWGGMENSSATTLYDGVLFDERAALDFRADELVAHELGHQWFGDLVTCREWAHAWLNEGFATYCEQLWLEHRFGADEAAWHRHLDREQVMGEDGSYRRAIVERRYMVPSEMFDSHLYEKGGWVLWMLRNVLGDADFRRAIHTYIERNLLRHVTTDDLQKACEDATGRSLQWFFDQWVYRAGHPEFKVAYRWDAENSAAHLSVEQTQTVDAQTPLFRMPVVIAFGLEPGKIEYRTVDLRGPRDGFDFRLPSRPRWVRFDSGERILKTLDFERPEELLLAQMREDDAIGRADACVQLGRLGSARGVTALAETLRSDPFWGVQGAAAAALADARSKTARQALLDNLSHPHPKVRRAIADALGAWTRDEEIAARLGDFTESEPAYRAVAAAARSLGRLEAESSLAVLERLSTRTSHQDFIRYGVSDGLRLTRRSEAVPILRTLTTPPLLDRLRRYALSQLGALGRNLPREERTEIRREIEPRLDDPLLMVRLGAAQGLAALGEAAAIPALERLQHRDPDGKIVSAAGEAIRHLTSGAGPADEVANLRGELERLTRRETELRERVEKIEAKDSTSK